jgi:hypothetical protein
VRQMILDVRQSVPPPTHFSSLNHHPSFESNSFSNTLPVYHYFKPQTNQAGTVQEGFAWCAVQSFVQAGQDPDVPSDKGSDPEPAAPALRYAVYSTRRRLGTAFRAYLRFAPAHYMGQLYLIQTSSCLEVIQYILSKVGQKAYP